MKKKLCIYLKEKTYLNMMFYKEHEDDNLSEFINKAIENYCQVLYHQYINEEYENTYNDDDKIDERNQNW